MSDTPRTNDLVNRSVASGDDALTEDLLMLARRLERELNATRQCLRGLRDLVADDSFAITFQSLAQYRAVVQREIEKSVVIAGCGEPNHAIDRSAGGIEP